MTVAQFIGRNAELAELKRQARKNIASLVIMKGRRRIGKSRLIEEFCKDYQSYTFVGLPPNKKTTKKSQLNEFASQLHFAFGRHDIKSDDWNDLFLFLAKHSKRDRVVIVLDEISWIGSKDPDFLGRLKNAWDLYFKKNPKLMLIICGSTSTWIEKNIMLYPSRLSFPSVVRQIALRFGRSD